MYNVTRAETKKQFAFSFPPETRKELNLMWVPTPCLIAEQHHVPETCVSKYGGCRHMLRPLPLPRCPTLDFFAGETDDAVVARRFLFDGVLIHVFISRHFLE